MQSTHHRSTSSPCKTVIRTSIHYRRFHIVFMFVPLVLLLFVTIAKQLWQYGLHFFNILCWHAACFFNMVSIHVRHLKFSTEQVLYLYMLLICHVRSPSSKNGHPQYRFTDTWNTSWGRILRKISCVLWCPAILVPD